MHILSYAGLNLLGDYSLFKNRIEGLKTNDFVAYEYFRFYLMLQLSENEVGNIFYAG